MPDESIFVLDFIDRIGRHWRTFRANFGADEKLSGRSKRQWQLWQTHRRNAPISACDPAARAIPTRSVPAAVAVFLLPEASYTPLSNTM